MTWRDRAVFPDQQARYDACRGHEITPFLFIFLSAVCPHWAAPFLSVNFLVFRFRHSPSCCCIATMLTASFYLKPDLSPLSWLEGLHHNIAAIGSTPPPPTMVSSLRRVHVLAQGMGEGLSLKLSGQASGKWYVRLSRFLVVANARGLRGGKLGGRHCHGTPIFPWS